MLIASSKYDDNIAEYILYMWHLEDMIRACKFSMELIRPNLIEPQSSDSEMLQKIEDWYLEFMQKMRTEGLEEKGHLGEVNDVLIELLYLHNSLLNITKDKAYETMFLEAQPYIKEFSTKSKTSAMNPVEVCLSGQYAKLLLKIQKKTITKETEEAFTHFRKILAYLALRYKEMRTGVYTAMSN